MPLFTKISSGLLHVITIALSECNYKKNPPFSQLFLCLSRACLGKMIIFTIKWRKKAAFSYLHVHTRHGEAHDHDRSPSMVSTATTNCPLHKQGSPAEIDRDGRRKNRNVVFCSVHTSIAGATKLPHVQPSTEPFSSHTCSGERRAAR